jgi:RNA polymerase sigma-70 factor (ECF subfamily)
MPPITAEELLAKYSDMAYNLALRLTGNAADAEDLAEEALVKALRGLDGFRGDCDAGIWLYRIVMNCWKSQLRSPRFTFWRRLKGFVDNETGELAEPQDPAPGPGQQLETAARKEAFEKALASLEPADRAIITLRELDGRSYTDISDALSIPEGTVRSRLARAREKLRVLLSGLLEGK